MKKVIILVMCIALIFIAMPKLQVSAYNANSYGTIIAGQEYSGETPLNDVGNHIPIRFEFPLAENSMIRIIMYTQSNCDSSLYINSEDAPYDTPEGYNSFAGRSLTAVDDFYNPIPNVFSTSCYSCTADMRNTNADTEVFGDLAAGNYYVVVTGATYRFKVITEPLLYKGTTDYANFSQQTAASYMIGKEQEGVFVLNGAVNGEYFPEEKTVNSWYKFDAGQGKYQLKLYSDGFFQGIGEIISSDGSYITGSDKTANAYFDFSTESLVAADFTTHLSMAGKVYQTNFEIKTEGTYYVLITRRTWTSGSYQFQVSSNPVAAIAKIKPAKATLNVKVGTAVTNKVTAYYEDGTKKTITTKAKYKSSSNNLVISKKGLLKAKKKGTYTVTVTYGGKKISFKVVAK